MGRKRITRQDLPERVYVRRKCYCYLDRSNKWHRLSKDFNEAMRMWAALLDVPAATETVGDLMDGYIRCERFGELAKRTQADYLGAIAMLRPVFGRMLPADVEPKHVYGYMAHRKARTKPVKTESDDVASPPRQAKTRANREVATLSAVMQFGIEQGAISINPCHSVKRLPERARRNYVDDELVIQLRPHCPTWLQLYIDLKLHTGLRQGDLLALRADSIKPDGLFSKTNKTGREILFKWSPDLKATIEALTKLRKGRSSLALFPSRDKTPLSQRGFKSAWQRAMKKAVAAGLSKHFTENDIRAKVATDAHRQGKNATDLLGHEDPSTTRRNYIRGPLEVEPMAGILHIGQDITHDPIDNER